MLVLLCGLSGVDSQRPWDLDKYVQCQQLRVPGKDLSGIAYHPDNTLWVVRDDVEDLRQIAIPSVGLAWDPDSPHDATVIRTVDLIGFKDLEGLTWVEGATFALSEETGRIVLVNVTHSATAGETVAEVDISEADANSGLEGLAYDPDARAFYAVKEKDPVRLIRVPASAGLPPTTLAVDADALHIDDLSGLHYSPVTGTLVMLSDQSRRVVQATTTGALLSRRDLDIPQMEGISFTPSGHRMFVAAEPNEVHIFCYGDCNCNTPPPRLALSEIQHAPLEGQGEDFIEVINLGPDEADLTGLRLADKLVPGGAACEPSDCFEIGSGGPQCAAANLTLAAGQVRVFRRHAPCSFAFGLSSSDGAFLLSGSTPLDALRWTADTAAPPGASFGRTLNGTGPFQVFEIPTPGRPNEETNASDTGGVTEAPPPPTAPTAPVVPPTVAPTAPDVAPVAPTGAPVASVAPTSGASDTSGHGPGTPAASSPGLLRAGLLVGISVWVALGSAW